VIRQVASASSFAAELATTIAVIIVAVPPAIASVDIVVE